ncbi:MAG: hypothetical protein ABIM99_01565 [Candidatus Dojkabacteria bacterium]
MRHGIVESTTELPISPADGLGMTKVKSAYLDPNLIGNIQGIMGQVVSNPKLTEWHNVDRRAKTSVLVLRKSNGYEAIIFSNVGNVKRIQYRLHHDGLIEIVDGKVKLGEKYAKIVPNPRTSSDLMFAAA